MLILGGESCKADNKDEQGPSTLINLKQEDDYDFWTESYASDDDEIPTKQMSQDIIEEVSLTIDEAKLKKMVDEMLRQRCTPGDENQYHIDKMKNFLKTPPLSLINQDLLYLKKGSLGPEKIVLSLHKFSAIIFNDDDIEEQTSIWVNKCVKKFNPYARYGVEHWKNPHAKIFYIRKKERAWKTKGSDLFELKDHSSYQDILGIGFHEWNIYKNEVREIGDKTIRDFIVLMQILKEVLEGLRSYNNDVKYGYIQRDLTNEEVEYLKLFEEEIEVRLKYQNQMRSREFLCEWEETLDHQRVTPEY
ncbi:hypothetical protein Tco_0784281 [Tanacetum coccineum]